MDIESRKKLKELLLKHEQLRQFPYIDTTGHLTIGVGRNLSDRGISSAEALSMLDDDIFYFTSKLSNILPEFNMLDDIRRIVLVDMCFNLGINGLLKFSGMFAAIKNSEWDLASKEILDSEAARQCPDRYQQLAYIMRTGELN